MYKDHPLNWWLHCTPPLCYCPSMQAKPTTSLLAQTFGRKISPEDRTGSGSTPVIPVKKKPVHPLQLVLPELVTVLILSRLLQFLPGVWSGSLLGEGGQRTQDTQSNVSGAWDGEGCSGVRGKVVNLTTPSQSYLQTAVAIFWLTSRPCIF